MMKRFSFTFTHRPWTTLSDLIGLQLGLQSIQLSSELSFHRGHIHCLQLQNFATWTTHFRTAHHKRVMPTLKSHLFYVQVSPSCICTAWPGLPKAWWKDSHSAKNQAANYAQIVRDEWQKSKESTGADCAANLRLDLFDRLSKLECG